MTRLSGNNQNRTMLIVGTLIAAALIGLALFAVRSPKPATTGDAQTFTYANMPFAGQANAPVNVVVVEDFKCPACKSFEETAAPEIRSKYVGTGKVKMYSLIYPFIAKDVVKLAEDDSKYAAQAALCVYRQGKNDAFNTYKEILFRAQGPESEVWFTKTRLKELAGSLDIDQATFATCLDNDETAADADAFKQEAIKAGVTGTPAIFVNGKKVNVEKDYVKDISAAIDAELKDQ